MFRETALYRSIGLHGFSRATRGSSHCLYERTEKLLQKDRAWQRSHEL